MFFDDAVHAGPADFLYWLMANQPVVMAEIDTVLTHARALDKEKVRVDDTGIARIPLAGGGAMGVSSTPSTSPGRREHHGKEIYGDQGGLPHAADLPTSCIVATAARRRPVRCRRRVVRTGRPGRGRGVVAWWC
jgi:hypothetical protein